MQRELFDDEYSNLKGIIFEKIEPNSKAFILDKEVLRLLALLSSEKDYGNLLIPNLGLGELALCAKRADAYSIFFDTIDTVKRSIYGKECNLFQSNFLDKEITEKYATILLFTPVGDRSEQDHAEILYIEKCLDLLAENGRLVIICPQYILTSLRFRDVRERILREFSLEAIFDLDRKGPAAVMSFSIIVIENKVQRGQIYMTFGNGSADDVYDRYMQREGGFLVESHEVYDRFDVSYYNPKYKEIRNLIHKRDTVKLGDIADIFTGCMITGQERKTFGDYLVITPQYLHSGRIYLENGRKFFCDKEFVVSSRKVERCVLKNGDVLISMIGKISWAVYHGEEDYVIVNQNIAIIRGRSEYEEWLRLFFNTRTGVEYLESQLKYISHCGVINRILRRDLINMYVPDIKIMKATESVNKEIELEAKVASLFRSLGWNVKEEYRKNDFQYDFALFDQEIFKGVVEVKSYKSDQISNDQTVARKLRKLKENVEGAGVYLFVDDEICEYIDGSVKQLLELPRPGKIEVIKETQTNKEKESKDILPIEKGSIDEMSLVDKLSVEMATNWEKIFASLNRIEGKIDNIAEKIEQLSKQIMGYQSLVKKQLELAVSSEEEERIIHAFSEEYAERILREVRAKDSEREYNLELHKLVLSFGENAWKKMEESSQTFLVSSKVIFNNLISLKDIVDYSGVCLLVTKALEVEMGKRFCKNFIDYLKQKYPGKTNFVQFPTALLDKCGEPLQPKHFTLGSVAYVLCYFKSNEITDEQKKNNKEKLIEYAREKLFTNKTDEDIFNKLQDYAKSVEKVRTNYRNPSAHTNELHRVDAEQCFALVVDVEKILKKMLDSFNE